MKKTAILMACCLIGSAHAAQTCQSGVAATAPASHFTVNADNTVTDNTTGLTWMRCSLGQTGSDCIGGSALKYTWAAALNEVINNYSGWRLPNINELSSIVELKCTAPAINITVFPNTQSDFYWSSSPYAGSNGSVIGIYFFQGGDSYNNKDERYYVRLVRGGL